MMAPRYFKLEIFLPESHFDAVRDALAAADAGHIGIYDRCLSVSRVTSQWRPLDGAQPYNGTVGQLCVAEELKVEVCCAADRLEHTLDLVRAAHPYEVPVINILPLCGIGVPDADFLKKYLCIR